MKVSNMDEELITISRNDYEIVKETVITKISSEKGLLPSESRVFALALMELCAVLIEAKLFEKREK